MAKSKKKEKDPTEVVAFRIEKDLADRLDEHVKRLGQRVDVRLTRNQAGGQLLRRAIELEEKEEAERSMAAERELKERRAQRLAEHAAHQASLDDRPSDAIDPQKLRKLLDDDPERTLVPGEPLGKRGTTGSRRK
jgi:hypothetical protein